MAELPMPKDYEGSVCEIKTMENELIAIGKIKEISQKYIKINNEKKELQIVDYGTSIKVNVFNGKNGFTGWKLSECRPVAKMGSGSMGHRTLLSRSTIQGHSLCMRGCRFRGLGMSISRGRCTLRKCKENIWKGGCRRCCEGKLSEAGACFVPMSENKKS